MGNAGDILEVVASIQVRGAGALKNDSTDGNA